MNPTPQDLANEFVIIVREWTTETQRREIDRRNALPKYRGLCASHDFCDPNQAMIDALARFNVELDIHDEKQIALTDAAWTLAKQQGFSTPCES